MERTRDDAKEKISVTVDRQVWTEARALPWASSGSAVVNEALRRLVAAERLGAMLDRLSEEHGPVDEDLVAEAEAKWFGE
ncbi:MAG: CopG family transcriptional regulator [Egibacteraceae bacterium]